MRRNTKTIIKGIIIMLSIFCIGIAYAQDPIDKPKRPTSTQQIKPKQTTSLLTKPKQTTTQQTRHKTDSQNQIVQSRKQVVSGTINGHDYVDLGLSVKWATCNIGAAKPEEYGDYFAWGETSIKASYSIENSDWYDVSYNELQSRGVINSKGNLRSQYDAARQKWGSTWRMPTKSEIDELCNKCTWNWTTEGGKNGYNVTGPNGNSIFLPAGGYRGSKDFYDTGSYGNFWCATAYNYSSYAYKLYFHFSNHNLSNFNRYFGLSIRPVTELGATRSVHRII